MNNVPTRVTILINPAARRAGRFDVARATESVRAFGVDPTVIRSQTEKTWVEAARESAARGDQLLFAVGGDGSLRLAAGALAGSATALAPLPAGTANVWAHEAGIPTGQDGAIAAVMAGQDIQVDLGYAGDEPFLLLAGIGWDAAIAAQIRPALKRRIGVFAYLWQAALAIPRLHPRRLNWTIDGHPASRRAGLIVLGNTRLYGGMVQFTPEASAVDGRLDVCAVAPRRPFQGTYLAARLAVKRLDGPGVLRALASEVAVETPGIPYQLDGDPIGVTPTRFTIRPGALRVRVPSGSLPAFLRPLD